MDLDYLTSSALVHTSLGTLLPVTWQSGRSLSDHLVIIFSTILHGTLLPGPGTAAGPFPRTKGTWVLLPLALCNSKPPSCLSASSHHFRILPYHMDLPQATFMTCISNCQLSLVFGHQACVKNPQRDLTTCLFLPQQKEQTPVSLSCLNNQWMLL